MPIYRLYCIEGARVRHVAYLTADDDSAAVAEVQETRHSDLCELWAGSRLVAQLGSFNGTEGHATNLEDLAESETEILPLLARGLSNREIARRLGIPQDAARERVERLSRLLRQHARKLSSFVFLQLLAPDSLFAFTVIA